MEVNLVHLFLHQTKGKVNQNLNRWFPQTPQPITIMSLNNFFKEIRIFWTTIFIFRILPQIINFISIFIANLTTEQDTPTSSDQVKSPTVSNVNLFIFFLLKDLEYAQYSLHLYFLSFLYFFFLLELACQ